MIKKIFSMMLLVGFSLSVAIAKDMQKVDITADMECNACKNKIERALKKTEGVGRVSVDLKEKNVTVQYDKDVVTAQKLVDVINNDAKIKASLKEEETSDSAKEKAIKK